VETACTELGVSQRKACQTLNQSRSSQRYELRLPVKDAAIIEAIQKHIEKRPRFGYRRITVELRKDHWIVNFKRVYRIWRDHDWGVPKKKGRKKHGRDGGSQNACHKKKPEHINHVWSYDFMHQTLENGRKAKLLSVLDEYTRECLTIDVGTRITAQDVIDVLRYLFLVRGEPVFIRSDNGPEFTAKKVKKWLKAMGVKTLFIEPGSPWENGYMESFNGHMRDECLDREIFVGTEELRYICEKYRLDYNHHRPHQSLGYLTPAQYAAMTRIPGALPPIPRNLSRAGSEHHLKEAGRPKAADAPTLAACSGCIPAEPYPCRDTESIRYKTGDCNTAEKMN
jgi:transposase InsO family protein